MPLTTDIRDLARIESGRHSRLGSVSSADGGKRPAEACIRAHLDSFLIA